jgi:glycosyltransferase involved in cell wall biosynthesis
MMFSASVPTPKDIFHPAKMLLAPSLREASGRVVAEAMLNGVPPLVSDRGGLAETANGSGFVLPLPADLDLKRTIPVEAPAVQPWIDVITRLEDDADFYAAECAKAKSASRRYLRSELAPQYLEFFEKIA